jgi:hypothetical protein
MDLNSAELKNLLKQGFGNLFEDGRIERDDFTIFETSADLISSTPSETRNIFAKHDKNGVTNYIEIREADKNKIREAYPELENWVVIKQNVKESDFDKDFTASNENLVDRLEVMIHNRSLDKKDANERVKDLEVEFKEVDAIEKSGFVFDLKDSELETSDEEPTKMKSKTSFKR